MRVGKWVCAIFILCILLIPTGCAKSPPDPVGYLGGNFSAELCGTNGEAEFCGVVTVENCDGGRLCTVRYITPEILRDVEITLLYTTDGDPRGDAEIKAPGGFFYTASAVAVEGLCAPLRCLVSAPEISAVQKLDSGYLFTHPDGSVLVLSESGIPVKYDSPSIAFEVVWFQEG